MKALIAKIEKMKPLFQKISNISYLMAVHDGFISLIPVIVFSSVFLLVAYVPNIFNFYWSADVTNTLIKVYNYSMGVLALLMSATIAKSLTDTFNSRLPKTRQINMVSTMAVSTICFLLVAADPTKDGFASAFLGTKGLLAAFVVAFTVPNIYKFCVGRNITIKMPDEVPGNISQTFADLIPLCISILFFWLFDMGFRNVFHTGFAAWILDVFKPLFSAADTYPGLAVIYGAMAFFWFVGIHGPSIVEPAVSAIYITNVDANLKLFQAGQHATHVLSQGSQYFVATIGGTGATLIITFMFLLMAKSKQLKVVGKASIVPVLFGVNEPILFGGPLVLNPVFFIPFIVAPIANVWIFKFFVGNLGMNGFIYNLPWPTPGPIGLILGTGFAPLVFIFIPLILVVDFIIYYPFFKVYDKQLVEEEATRHHENGVSNEDTKLENVKVEKIDRKLAILVICANGATSSMLAKAIKKGADAQGIDLESTALAYGQHKDVIDQFDLIILAPQMASMLDQLKKDCGNKGVKAISTNGKQYVDLTRNPEKALKFAFSEIENK